jgi:hypothetical protein
MKISVGPDGELIIEKPPESLFQALKSLPECPELEDANAIERLYPLPDLTDPDSETNSDWKAFVQPELIESFRSDRQVVAIDLHAAEVRHKNQKLVIPRNHFDAWLGALNQARLAIAAAHGFGEAEMSRNPLDLPQALIPHAFRLHLYAGLQELLIEAEKN